MDTIIINRISSANQADGYSLAAQEKYGKAYAAEKSFNVLESYSFQETASKSAKRKIFNQILNKIYQYEGKEALNVVAEKVDRLIRNSQDGAEILDLCKQGKIIVHLYKENRILGKDSTPQDFFIYNIMTAVGTLQADMIGAEAIKGMREKCEQGWFPQQAPFGYMNVEEVIDGKKMKIIKPHPQESEIVKLIFTMRTQGKSFEEIRQLILNNPLLPENRLSKFKHKSSVEWIIKSPFYIGRFHWRGQWYDGKHELFIDKETFEKAQKMSQQPTSRINQKKGTFTNWLMCECGCKVTYDPKIKKIKSTGETKIYHYYRCSNGKKRHEKYPYLSEEKIFSFFEEAIDRITITGELAENISKALNKSHQQACDARKRDIETYEAHLKKFEEKECEAYADYKDGILPKEVYMRHLSNIANQRENITNLMAKAQRQIDDAYLTTAEEILELAQNAKLYWSAVSKEEKRSYLEKILSNRVFDYPSVRYTLKKPFQTLFEMASSSKWLPELYANLNRSITFPLEIKTSLGHQYVQR